MRSPPISCPIEARSSVVATTFSLDCANAVCAPSSTANDRRNFFMSISQSTNNQQPRTNNQQPQTNNQQLKRVRAMRTNRKLELEQELVRVFSGAVVRPPVLSADLAELARPVRQRERTALVDDRR